METNKLKSLSDVDLLVVTKTIVAAERKITLSVLQHLQEVNCRRLYAIHHASLWDYCTKELGYSEPAAHRRISAMRLLTAAKMQNFFRAAHKIENNTFSTEEKLELLNYTQNKTSREQDHLLATIAPKAAAKQSERVLDTENTELRITADKELMTLLTQIKERYAHKLNGKTDYASLLKLMAEVALAVKRAKASASSDQIGFLLSGVCTQIHRSLSVARQPKKTLGLSAANTISGLRNKLWEY